MKHNLRKYVFILVAIVLCLSCVLLVGCVDDDDTDSEEFKASFVRFSIGERQTDYFLDFTIRFENNTNQTVLIEGSDFYVEINGEEITNISFLYEYEDTFYTFPTVESGETLVLRLRAIAQVKMQERNKIVVNYNDSMLVDDNVYFNKK